MSGEIEITVNQVIPDIIPPTISCPTFPEALPATAGQNSAIVNFDPPLAVDNSGQVSVIQTEGLASGSVFPLGETINTFIATDASGNSTSCSFTISIVNVPLSASILPVTICQKSNLELKVTTIGGAGGNTYAWSGPNGFINTTDHNPILPYIEGGPSLAGTYLVTVTDGGGASATASIVVTESTNAPITLTTSLVPDCNTFNGSEINLIASGGVGPYVYHIFGDGNINGNGYGVVNGNILTMYSLAYNLNITATDAEGCKGSINYSSPHIQPPFITGVWATRTGDTPFNWSYSSGPEGVQETINVCEGTNRYLYMSIGGGYGEKTYSWVGPNNYQSSEPNPFFNNISLNQNGLYTLNVTDQAGCTATKQVTLNVLENQPFSIISGSSSLYVNAPNTTYTTDAVNPAQVSYTLAPWNAGTISPEGVVDWDDNFVGEATIIASLNIQCGGTVSKTVTIKQNLTVAIGTITPTNCEGPNVGAVEIIPSGGNAPYTIIPAQTGLAVGTHNFLVTDADMNTKEVVVEIPNISIDTRFEFVATNNYFFQKRVCANTDNELTIYSNSPLLVPGTYEIVYDYRIYPNPEKVITTQLIVTENGIGKFNFTTNLTNGNFQGFDLKIKSIKIWKLCLSYNQ